MRSPRARTELPRNGHELSRGQSHATGETCARRRWNLHVGSTLLSTASRRTSIRLYIFRKLCNLPGAAKCRAIVTLHVSLPAGKHGFCREHCKPRPFSRRRCGRFLRETTSDYAHRGRITSALWRYELSPRPPIALPLYPSPVDMIRYKDLPCEWTRGYGRLTDIPWRLAAISASARSPLARSFSLLYRSSSRVSVENSWFCAI